MFILDTDHFSVVLDQRHSKHDSVLNRIRGSVEPVALSVVSIEEQLRSWLAEIRRRGDVRRLIYPYDRLIRLLEVISDWEIIRWGEPAASEYERLKKERVRIGTQYLKIASICLAQDAVLLSANLRDFEQVPGLRVEDWLRA